MQRLTQIKHAGIKREHRGLGSRPKLKVKVDRRVIVDQLIEWTPRVTWQKEVG